MEIRTKNELKFFIMADLMMNRGYFRKPILYRIKGLFFPDYIMSFLKLMRKLSYYSHAGGIYKIWSYFIKYRYYRLGLKLGFNIGCDAFGYGLVLPHYGSLGCGSTNRFGNYCVIHTLTSVTDNGKIIGDALYLAKGAIITSRITLGNNISVGANSVVNKSFENDNIMIAGAPAKYIKDALPWYIRDGKTFSDRVNKVEFLKKQFGL